MVNHFKGLNMRYSFFFFTMYVKSKQFNLLVIDELNKVINIAKQFVFLFFFQSNCL